MICKNEIIKSKYPKLIYHDMNLKKKKDNQVFLKKQIILEKLNLMLKMI